jgi:hypothetical protein
MNILDALLAKSLGEREFRKNAPYSMDHKMIDSPTATAHTTLRERQAVNSARCYLAWSLNSARNCTQEEMKSRTKVCNFDHAKPQAGAFNIHWMPRHGMINLVRMASHELPILASAFTTVRVAQSGITTEPH